MEITWLASYPRSGNTWLRFLLSAYAIGELSDWSDCNKIVGEIHWWMDFAKKEGLSDEALVDRITQSTLRQQDSPFAPSSLVLKTHFEWTESHPLSKWTARVIYLVRNPRDILLSGINYHRFNKDMAIPSEQEYARTFIKHGGDARWIKAGFGSCDGHSTSWLEGNKTQTLVIRYEDLKHHPDVELARILEFLSVPLDEKRLRFAVDEVAIEKLRDIESNARQTGRFAHADPKYSFINSGRTGQSLDQIELGLDRLCNDRFSGLMRNFQYA